MIAQMNCAEVQARANVAKAELSMADLKLAAKRSLRDLKGAGDIEVPMAATDVEKARGALALSKAQLGYCPMLASRYKGPLMVANERDTLIPNPALFHVLVQLDAPPPSLWETRGQLQIDGSRRSLLYDGVTHLAAGLIRESGF